MLKNDYNDLNKNCYVGILRGTVQLRQTKGRDLSQIGSKSSLLCDHKLPQLSVMSFKPRCFPRGYTCTCLSTG